MCLLRRVVFTSRYLSATESHRQPAEMRMDRVVPTKVKCARSNSRSATTVSMALRGQFSIQYRMMTTLEELSSGNPSPPSRSIHF